MIMNGRILITSLLIIFTISLSLKAQHNYYRPSELYVQMEDVDREMIIGAFNDLFRKIPEFLNIQIEYHQNQLYREPFVMK